VKEHDLIHSNPAWFWFKLLFWWRPAWGIGIGLVSFVLINH
jgi:hypothetical protein